MGGQRLQVHLGRRDAVDELAPSPPPHRDARRSLEPGLRVAGLAALGHLVRMGIKRNGRDVAVVLSPAEFARLTAAMPGEVSARVKELHARSVKRFGAVYEDLAK